MAGEKETEWSLSGLPGTDASERETSTSEPVEGTSRRDLLKSGLVGLACVGGGAATVWYTLARAGAIHLFAELELVVIYLMMVLVLAFRPQGLFGQVEERRI